MKMFYILNDPALMFAVKRIDVCKAQHQFPFHEYKTARQIYALFRPSKLFVISFFFGHRSSKIVESPYTLINSHSNIKQQSH